MSWALYSGLLFLLTFLVAVVYALLYAFFLGVRENYLRHYQKAELQWTGAQQSSNWKPRLWRLLVISFLTAWLILTWWSASR